MKYFLSILLMSFCTATFAQHKTMNLPESVKNDTGTFLKLKRAEDALLHLHDLTTSYDSVHFRFNFGKEHVDIYVNSWYKKDDALGVITKSPFKEATWVTNGDMMSQVEGSIENIDSRTAKKILDLFMKNHVFDIPQQDSITEWKTFVSDDSYFIEYSTPTYYSLKMYVAPQLFKDVNEAQTIANVMQQAEVLLKGRRRVLVGGMIDRIKR